MHWSLFPIEKIGDFFLIIGRRGTPEKKKNAVRHLAQKNKILQLPESGNGFIREKVIHNPAAGKCQKMSYTPSYSRYPQQTGNFVQGKEEKNQTNVL